jgi:AraC-like DNA-binding protein
LPHGTTGLYSLASGFVILQRKWLARFHNSPVFTASERRDAALREHVRCVWVNDLSESQNEWLRVVPDGCADIVWTGRSLMVAGPDSRSILDRLPRGTVVVGIRFQPGAASAWLGLPLSEIVDCRVPLAELWRNDADRLLDKVTGNRGATDVTVALETFLSSRLAQVGPADRQIAYLRRAAGDNCHPAGVRVDRMAAHIGMSERTLRRRCVYAFGYGFKTLDRVLRFQRFMRLAAHSSKGSLAELATRSGYADQAHMTREVRRMSGTTAGEFVSNAQGGLADSFKTAVAGHL